MLACASDFQDVTQTPGAVGTVVEVTWWSPTRAVGRVAVRGAGDVQLLPAERTLEDGGFRYTATLLGLASDEEAPAILQLLDSSGAKLEEQRVIVEAGRLDMVLPPVTTTARGGSLDGFLLTSFLYEPSAAVVLNTEGVPVWAVEGREGALISETRLHPDGGEILYCEYGLGDGTEVDEQSQLVRVDLRSGEQTRQHAPGLHHDFVVLPDGVVAYLSHDRRQAGGEWVLGDAIMELSEDGALVEVWSAWDTIPYSEETPSESMGWTHANALVYDPDEQAYYVSLYNYNAILKICRQTGGVEWILGGPLSDFALSEDDAFLHQHNFQLLDDDRILLFDNGPQGVRETEALEIALDTTAMTAEVVWRYQPEDPVNTLVFGDVERLGSGNTLVTFSGSGLIEETTPEGEALWSMDTPFGAAFGYSQTVPDAASFFQPQ